MKELVYPEPKAPEHVWQALPGGPDVVHRGEVWQQVGAHRDGDHVAYDFRHRRHPETDDHRYVMIADTPGGPVIMNEASREEALSEVVVPAALLAMWKDADDDIPF